jgi:hypothetical protein
MFRGVSDKRFVYWVYVEIGFAEALETLGEKNANANALLRSQTLQLKQSMLSPLLSKSDKN